MHTRELPRRNKTDDTDIIQLSMNQNRIVVSKDEDFFKYFILKAEPYKLLTLTMGNIDNKGLISLFEKNISQIEEDLTKHKVVELNYKAVIVHF